MFTRSLSRTRSLVGEALVAKVFPAYSTQRLRHRRELEQLLRRAETAQRSLSGGHVCRCRVVIRSNSYRLHQLFDEAIHRIADCNSYHSIEAVFGATHDESNQEQTGPNKHDCWEQGIAAGSEGSR